MASTWVVVYSGGGLLAGLVGGAILGSGVGALAVTLGGARASPWVTSWEMHEARDYRLRAQRALCQAQIEANTRRPLSYGRQDVGVKFADKPLISAER